MNSAIFAIVAQVISEQLVISLESVQAGSRLVDSLNADSMDLAEISMELESRFGNYIENNAWKDWGTVADIVIFLEGKGVTV